MADDRGVPPTSGPLTGISIVECGQGVSAAYAVKLMADLGADVVKVEPPGGDLTRRRGPFPADKPDPEHSGLFQYLNTNKRGVTLDLTTAVGRARLDWLAGSIRHSDSQRAAGGPERPSPGGGRDQRAPS